MNKQTTEPMAAPVVLDYGSPNTLPRPAHPLATKVFEGVVMAGIALVTWTILISPTHIAGAQRSVKIKWEQRQQEIQQAALEQQGPKALP